MPTSIDSIYDLTIGYSVKPPGIGDAVMRGKFRCRGIHIHCERIPFADLPKDDKGISDWLLNRFVAKDKLLAHFNQHGVFPGERQPVSFPQYVNRWSTLWMWWGAVFSLFVGWATGRAWVGYTSAALTVWTLVSSLMFAKRVRTSFHLHIEWLVACILLIADCWLFVVWCVAGFNESVPRIPPRSRQR